MTKSILANLCSRRDLIYYWNISNDFECFLDICQRTLNRDKYNAMSSTTTILHYEYKIDIHSERHYQASNRKLQDLGVSLVYHMAELGTAVLYTHCMLCSCTL